MFVFKFIQFFNSEVKSMGYDLERRGGIDVKGKGIMDTYFVNGVSMDVREAFRRESSKKEVVDSSTMTDLGPNGPKSANYAVQARKGVSPSKAQNGSKADHVPAKANRSVADKQQTVNSGLCVVM